MIVFGTEYLFRLIRILAFVEYSEYYGRLSLTTVSWELSLVLNGKHRIYKFCRCINSYAKKQ